MVYCSGELEAFWCRIFLFNTKMEMLILFHMVVWGWFASGGECLGAAAACGDKWHNVLWLWPLWWVWAACVALQDRGPRQAEPHLCSRETAPLLSLLFLANDYLKMAPTGSEVILYCSLVFGAAFLVAFSLFSWFCLLSESILLAVRASWLGLMMAF